MRKAAAPLALVAAGLLIRLSSWRAVFQDGHVLFVDSDDYFHLRRMMNAAALFPRLPALDRYLGFPDAPSHRWPPLYDWLAGGALRLGGLDAPERAAAFAAFLPPLFGALTLWVFWRLCLRLMDRRAALWALAGAAVLPQLVFYTLLGRPDHHSLENLFLVCALLPALRLAQGQAPVKNAALAAAALAAGTWCFVGFPVFGGLVFLWMLEQRRREAALIFLLQVPLLLPGAFGAAGRGGAFAFDTLSFFQPLAALALGAWLLAAAEARARPRLAAGLAGAGFLVGMTLARLSTESFAGFAAGAPAAFAGFTELEPLLRPGGRWGAGNLLSFLGLLPLAAVWAWRAWKREPDGPKPRLILVWAAGTGVLALLQSRYSLHFSLALCALLAPWAARVPLAAIALALPALWNTAKVPLVREALVGTTDLAQAAAFLRERTPPTRSLWSDQGPPEYGVHAHLGIGATLAALGQRPVAAANAHWLGPAIDRSLALFSLTSAEDAERFLRLNRFRYAVLDATPAAPDSVAERLYLHDGGLARRADGSWAAPVDALRLVYESTGTARVKVFELVGGSRQAGRCRGAAPIIAQTQIEPSAGRRRPWRTFAACENGRYALRLPYSGLWRVREGGRSRAVLVEEVYSSSLR